MLSRTIRFVRILIFVHSLALLVPDVEELSCIGAAYMAGIAMGVYDEHVFDVISRERYTPKMDPAKKDAKRELGHRAAALLRTNKPE